MLVAVGVDDGLLLSAVWDRIAAMEIEEDKAKEASQGIGLGSLSSSSLMSSSRMAEPHGGAAGERSVAISAQSGTASSRANDNNPEFNSDQKFEADSIESMLARRLGRTLREAGPSVTLTSLTDAFAFAIGTAIDIGAIRQFCITSAVAVVAVWALQVTAFCAALVLDTRRREAGRMDCCPCLMWEVPQIHGHRAVEKDPEKDVVGEHEGACEDAAPSCQVAGAPN